jgi:Rrf2 family nitric oxide-sensitive transcriptional repressor
MQLTRFTDYTMRALIAVGVGQRDQVTIGDISAQYGISKNHLMKVVQHLSRTGYLETIRGKGGGLRLARPPEDINIGQVVRDTEGPFHVVPCFDTRRPDQCAISPACLLKRALADSLAAFLGVLDGYTLAHLLGPDRRLRDRLVARMQAQKSGRAARG